MDNKPQEDDFSHKVGVVTENVTRAAIATGAAVVGKTKDAASAIGKVAEAVAESEIVKGSVSYVQDKTSQAIDYLTGKSEEENDSAKDESKNRITKKPGKKQGTAKDSKSKPRKPKSKTSKKKAAGGTRESRSTAK